MDKTKALLKTIGICLFNKNADDEYLNSIQDEQFLIDTYKLARKHDVAHYLGYALEKLGMLGNNSAIHKILAKEQFTAVYRYENIVHEIKNITSLFEKSGIDCIILKGSYIRKLFPEEWLRTSCDIDILVRDGDVQRAIELLQNEYGYECRGKNGHDYQLYSKNGVHLELHFLLIEDDYSLDADKPLESVWDYTDSLDGQNHIFRMDDDMLYYYNAVHMAKHILEGGCGIKPLIDTLILNEKLNFTPEKERLLNEGGLMKFDELTTKLSRVWFKGEEGTEQTDRLAEYILFGGVYGNVENRVAARQEEKGGKLGYALQRIFLPYKSMVLRYPDLKNHKWRYPFYQFRRWVDLLREGRAAYSFHELKTNQTMSADQKNKTNSMLDDLGLK